MNECQSLCLSVFFGLIFSVAAFSQEQPQRPRFVSPPSGESQPINQPPPAPIVKRPTLTNQIIVTPPAPLVKKTGSSQPLNAPANATFNKNYYTATFSSRMMAAIQSKMGIPYRYGSMGPKTYDCSGFVWSVFNEAGFYFDRTSARSLWAISAPVEGDARYKFGTLVFFNQLGHIGIVADADGFYEASSSKGITYSRFDGYWAKRIVGFRQLQTPDVQK
ncbi:MAG: C40 family peptidase [Acidobacteriota bacterium]|nr:C40 family peptidase [Acidobacteriota bacterium]